MLLVDSNFDDFGVVFKRTSILPKIDGQGVNEPREHEFWTPLKKTWACGAILKKKVSVPRGDALLFKEYPGFIFFNEVVFTAAENWKTVNLIGKPHGRQKLWAHALCAFRVLVGGSTPESEKIEIVNAVFDPEIFASEDGPAVVV